jgi:HAD superfamily hydrolase (TIGR01509 family)
VERLSAVIFDLDGVLLESEQVWSAAKRELALARGGVWNEAAEREMLGMSSTEWSRYMRDRLRVPVEPGEISAAVVELVARRYREELPLIDGADAAVRALAARFLLGLASSSNRQIIDLVLELTGWGELFSVTLSSEEVAHGKPAPDVYLETARRLGVAPEACAAVEDSGAGIRSALAAGLTVVAIPNRAYPPDAEILGQADVVLDSLSQLEVSIDRLAAA